MDRPHMRPRLEILVEAPLDQVRTAFQQRLAHPRCTCQGKLARNHLHVEVADDRRHLWSPTLDVNLRETEEGTVLLGKFGPHPNLWTLYVFIYSACTFLGIVAACWASAQLVLEEPPTALLGVLGAGAVAGIAWASARIGARWGHDQMEDLVQMISDLGTPQRDDAHVVRGNGDEASAAPVIAAG